MGDSIRLENRDRIRQVVVAIGAVLAIAGATWGSGAFGGTPIEEAADGALAPDSTLLGAAIPAFQIWSLIYAGLALFAVLQALPSRASNARYRSTAWWVLASMVLNAAWIAVVQAGWLAASAVVLAAIVAVLLVTATRLAQMREGRSLDRVGTDVTVGVYLGWAAVATAANIAAVARPVGTVWALGSIVAVVLGVLFVMLRLRSRTVGPALAFASAWGLAWIGIARLDAPTNTVVAVTAFVAAGAATLAGVLELAGALKTARESAPVGG